ncbi:MAG: thiamine pyrophosphate-dependent enzyme, partial [Actinobacteria bacterium]|nr:thiamine pyrophosphate-dependent enzyme [Actinomycetota bacterium]
ELTRTADVILAVGTRFTEFDTSSWNPKYCFAIPPARLIHVDIDNEEIGKTYPVEVGIQGDARAVLEQMVEAAKDTTKRKDLATDARVRQIRSRMAAWYAAVEPNQRAKSSPIRPERILREVREILSPEDIIVTDTGWNKNGVGNQFPIYRPMTHLAPGGFATMGFGTAAVIGAKIGRPDRVALALIGDGAFSSVTPALATAVESGVSPIWVVMNNYSYGVITGLQRRNFKRTAWTEFVREESGEAYNPDFAALARAYGVEGVKVEDPEEFRPALEKAVKSGKPYVLDVIMDKEAAIPIGGLWDVNNVLEKGARR